MFGAKVLLILESKDYLIEDIVNHAIDIVREKYGIVVEYSVTYMPHSERAILINGYKIRIRDTPSLSELVDLIVILAKPIERIIEVSDMGSHGRISEGDLFWVSY